MNTKFVIFLISLALVSSSPQRPSFITYNTWGAPGFAPGIVERLNISLDEIVGLSPDFVCLDELYTEGARSAARAKFRASGYSTLLYNESIYSPPQYCSCSQAELVNLSACATTCLGELPCILTTCITPTTLFGLSAQCEACLLTNLENTDFNSVAGPCISGPSVPDPNGQCKGYGANSGNGFFSKTRPSSTQQLLFQSTLFTRGALVAHFPQLTVICTHLSTFIPVAQITPDDWKRENLDQIQMLIQLHAAFSERKPVVIMGDFNAGPVNPTAGITEEFSDNFQVLLNSGLHTAYQSSCTFCTNNPARTQGSLIDHIIYSPSQFAVVSSQTVVDNATVVLSDHFGIQAELRFVPPRA